MITINKDKDKDYYGKEKDDKDENEVVKKLTDSPMPQDLLHAPHGPQPVTWQFRGSGNTKICDKGAGTFHSAGQSKEGSVGFGTSQHPIFMKLLPDHLWH